MEKNFNIERIDLQELEAIHGGASNNADGINGIKGCGLFNGQCSTEGGCGITNGKCTTPTIPDVPDPTNPGVRPD